MQHIRKMTIQTGQNVPEDINVVIEISSKSDPIKYEYQETGMYVDRFLSVAMYFPFEYGFIPQTLSKDGDPLDAVVLSHLSIMTGAIINCRPIGLLRMTDEAGEDTKIIAVPNNKLTPMYDQVIDIYDLHIEERKRIKHFFEHYKDLQNSKWVKVEGFEGKQQAYEVIIEAIKAYKDAESA